MIIRIKHILTYFSYLQSMTLKLIFSILLIFLPLSAVSEDKTKLIFKNGASNEYEAEAIAFGLFEEISSALEMYVKDSHFIYGPQCEKEEIWSKPQFSLDFETSSIDLNNDRREEVIVIIKGVNVCGSGGCTAYILQNEGQKSWNMIGSFFSANNIQFSSNNKSGYSDIHFDGKWDSYSCTYKKTKTRYACQKSKK